MFDEARGRPVGRCLKNLQQLGLVDQDSDLSYYGVGNRRLTSSQPAWAVE